MSNKLKLQDHATDLQSILDTINALPEAGAGDAYAVIAVTYPEGSVCTCSNGSEVLELDNTIGYGFFLIPSDGEWTVTATDGTNSKSQAVEITNEGQFESVTIQFQLILIEPTTAAIAEGYTLTNTTITTDSTYGNYIKFSGAINNAGDNGYISPAVDVTNYSTLKIKACLYGNAAASNGYGTVGLYKELPFYTDPNPVAGIYMGSGYDDGNESWGLKKAKEYTVDISELTGNYYFSGYDSSWTPVVFYAIFE